MIEATTSSTKGQLTIPSRIREQLGLEPGTKVRFLVDDDGSLVLFPIKGKVLDLYGVLKDPTRRALTVEEMDEVVGADRVVVLERGTVVYAGGVHGLFGDAALVRRLGLGLPAAGELALELASRGRLLEPLPLTLAAKYSVPPTLVRERGFDPAYPF